MDTTQGPACATENTRNEVNPAASEGITVASGPQTQTSTRRRQRRRNRGRKLKATVPPVSEEPAPSTVDNVPSQTQSSSAKPPRPKRQRNRRNKGQAKKPTLNNHLDTIESNPATAHVHTAPVVDHEQEGDTKTIPAWWIRLRGRHISYYGFDPEEFDEDISDLSDSPHSQEETEPENKTRDWSLSDVPGSSSGSERSYQGSDASDYYAMHEMREERKLELRAKKSQMEFEKEKVAEVRRFESRQVKDRPLSLQSLVGRSYRLYSDEHVRCFWGASEEEYENDKTINFEHCAFFGEYHNDPSRLGGNLRIDYLCHYDLNDIDTPKHPTTFEAEGRDPMDWDNDPVRFLITVLSDEYIKVRIPRRFVVTEERDTPKSCPKSFTFYGIYFDKIREAALIPRAPSPADNWFNNNHPMGAYYDPRYAEDLPCDY